MLLGKGAVLVVFFVRKSPFFGDETLSRRRFWTENSFFWRRDPFSSSFLCGKLTFLATTPFLVVVLGRKTHFFGDDTPSRRRFGAENSLFWRRHPFSSSFWGGKLTFLATTPLLVVILWRKTHFFGDETPSRRHFVAENSLFWRRNPFSSSFCGGKLTFLATKPLLVVILWRKTLLFGDETLSRRRFCAGNFFFWRRDPFSSSFLRRKTSFFGDETRSRRRFWTENPLFWRRDPFSSSFLCRKLHFLATRLILVVVFGRKTHFFGDDTRSRRRFWTENSLFW
ncbi:hypothetical protein NSQ96_16355 [Caldifermentibacillus hisashii]|uniref:hypothetical protein n=1 Tax=Caldifermentibacillus hisashii TaxID=996558 RepID=UPI0031FCEB17